MKTINTNQLIVAVAAFGLSTLPLLDGVAQAKPGKAKAHGDNGKHLGWSKGKHKGWSNSNRSDRDDWDNRWDDRSERRSRRTTRSTNWQRNSVRNQWTKWRPSSTSRSNYRSSYRPVSSTRSNWRLHNSRPFGTRTSANQAAAARRRLGYRTAVSYDPNRRVYVLREYNRRGSNYSNYTPRRSTTRRALPVSSSRLIGTHYYPNQSAAAAGMRFAQSKGYRATSVYDRANNRWIVRTYAR